MIRLLLVNGGAFLLAGLLTGFVLAPQPISGGDEFVYTGWYTWKFGLALLLFFGPGSEAVFRTLDHGMRRLPFLLRYVPGLLALAVIVALVYSVWSAPVGLVVSGAFGGLAWGWLLSRWTMDGAARRSSALALAIGAGVGQMVGLALGHLLGGLLGLLVWGAILGFGVGIGVAAAVGEMNRTGRRPEELRTVPIEA